MKKSVLIYVLLAVLAIVIASIILIAISDDNKDVDKNVTINVTSVANETDTKDVVASEKTEAALKYLIEEEKLAQDVYVYMYDIYGSQVFKNIAASEVNHQEQILALMAVRNIEDPRIDTPGQFSNPELQALYDELIARGEQNEAESYKVGEIIEIKDIEDLQAEIDSTQDSDIKNTLEYLKLASEKHLSAFSRQL